jgi:hypothetical protein
VGEYVWKIMHDTTAIAIEPKSFFTMDFPFWLVSAEYTPAGIPEGNNRPIL